MEGNEEAFGPIDVVVIGYPPGAPKTGEAIPILLDLVDLTLAIFVTAIVRGFIAVDTFQTAPEGFRTSSSSASSRSRSTQSPDGNNVRQSTRCRASPAPTG